MKDRERDHATAALRFTRRGVLVGLGQVGLFGGLVTRLYQIQVLEGATLAPRAEENRNRQTASAPLRGRIFDANGVLLATNRETFRAILKPQRGRTLAEVQSVLTRVAALVRQTSADVDSRLLRAQRAPREPLLVVDNLTFEQVAALEVNRPDLPGIVVEASSARQYVVRTPRENAAMAHLVGYVGAVEKRALDDDAMLRLAEARIGKTGVEAGMDVELRGIAGSAVTEVDARGRPVRQVSETAALPGRDVALTIDVERQADVMACLGREANPGAVVVLDVGSGAVVVMASTPSFDGTKLSGTGSRDAWKALNAAPDHPLVNRCIAGQYPPGSTFKMVTALAALEGNVLTTKEKIECWGDVTYAGQMFRCWNRKGHIASDLHKALRESCDCYFYEAARRVGIEKIALMAKKLGLGQTFDAGIAQQKSGVVPTPAWKRFRNRRTGWLLGDTIQAGIGQGFVLATPLQLAVMTARLATGRMVTPTVVKRPSGDPAPTFAALDIAPAGLAAIRAGMIAVVNEPGGTGQSADLDDGKTIVAGKTGTSQVSRLSADRDRTVALETRHRDHAVFVAYAPANEPRYAVAVLLEHAGGGGAKAGPMVREVLELMFEHDRRDAKATMPPPDAAAVPSTPSERASPREARDVTGHQVPS
jgi:penicillin-binding protein 2